MDQTSQAMPARSTELSGRPLLYQQWGRVVFVGNFWEYFFISLLLLILSVLTLGLLLPYWAYWSLKYFFGRLRIDIAT